MATREEQLANQVTAYKAHLRAIRPDVEARLTAAINDEIQAIAVDPGLLLWIERLEIVAALETHDPNIGPTSAAYKITIRLKPLRGELS